MSRTTSQWKCIVTPYSGWLLMRRSYYLFGTENIEEKNTNLVHVFTFNSGWSWRVKILPFMSMWKFKNIGRQRRQQQQQQMFNSIRVKLLVHYIPRGNNSSWFTYMHCTHTHQLLGRSIAINRFLFTCSFNVCVSVFFLLITTLNNREELL